MAKKKIGSATVVDGVARGCFTLPDTLPKGVYELIGEYKGSSIYRPSYDVKKLIVGWKTDILYLAEWYKVDEYTRKVTVTGKLVGYNDEGIEQPLTNQKIGLKIGDEQNPLGKGVIELSKEALSLKTLGGSAFVTTDNGGNFTFEAYVPVVYDDWEYKLYVNYGGNYDYVSCVKQVPLYIGDAPTTTIITIKPSEHLHPQGGYLLESSVYLARDVMDNGLPKEGAEKITHGQLVFKESQSGQDGTFSNLVIDGTTRMVAVQLYQNSGVVRHRTMFNRPATDVFERYIYAQYGGSTVGYGYKSSKSRIIHIVVDSEGDILEGLNVSFPCANKETDVLFIPYDSLRSCDLTIKKGTSNVPAGVLEIRIDDT